MLASEMPSQDINSVPAHDASNAKASSPSDSVVNLTSISSFKDHTLPKQRYRRCMVEIISGHLGVLGREVRREIIARKLSQHQRLALEQFLSAHRLNLVKSLTVDETVSVEQALPQCNLSAACPTASQCDHMFTRPCGSQGLSIVSKRALPRKSNSQRCIPDSRRKLPIKRACAASSDESEDIVRISSQIKGGKKLYYAIMGINSLVFRCKSQADTEEVREHQTSLQKMKRRIGFESEKFEAQVMEAIAEIEKDRSSRGLSDWGLSVSVRVAATWWVGQDLTTPARTSQHIGAVLAEWRKLREIRGLPRQGGKGILYHHSLHAISSMWAELRSVYLNICGSKGANIKKLSAKLDAKVAQRELHRRKQMRYFLSMQHRRFLLQQHREHRLADLDARNKSRLQKKEARMHKMRIARETASLRALERLITKWSPRASRLKQSKLSHGVSLA